MADTERVSQPATAAPSAAATPVTVGVTAYSPQRAHYLVEAVASACAQTHDDIEIVICDDGGSAEVARVAAAACERDRRVRFVQGAARRGIAGNWNRLMEEASGDRVMIIGDDDRLLPDAVATMLRAGDADVVFANHFVIDGDGERVSHADYTVRYGRSRVAPGPVREPLPVIARNGISICAALLRRATALRQPFNAALNTPEQEYFFRIALEGATFAFVSDYVAEYRTHALSQTSAGLWIDRHVRAMMELPVPPSARCWQRLVVRQHIIGATIMAIANGESSAARRFVWSGYLPLRERPLSCAAVVAAAHAPGALVRAIPLVRQRRIPGWRPPDAAHSARNGTSARVR